MPTNANVNAQQVLNRIDTLLKQLENPQRLMFSIGETLKDYILEEFDTSGHGTWPALKFRKGGKPLMDTRRLYNSFTTHATANSATVSTNVEYAPLQNYGALQGSLGQTSRNTPIPWGDIPAREFLPVDASGQIKPDALERVMETVQRYINRRR